MKRFVVERNLPGAGNLTAEELAEISSASCAAIKKLNMPYHWLESFVTADKIFCIHVAESEEAIREHARIAKFPIHTISEVLSVLDPMTESGELDTN